MQITTEDIVGYLTDENQDELARIHQLIDAGDDVLEVRFFEAIDRLDEGVAKDNEDLEQEAADFFAEVARRSAPGIAKEIATELARRETAPVFPFPGRLTAPKGTLLALVQEMFPDVTIADVASEANVPVIVLAQWARWHCRVPSELRDTLPSVLSKSFKLTEERVRESLEQMAQSNRAAARARRDRDSQLTQPSLLPVRLSLEDLFAQANFDESQQRFWRTQLTMTRDLENQGEDLP